MLRPLKTLATLIAFLAVSHSAWSQFTKINDDPDAAFKEARELYQKGEYSLAYPFFKILYTQGVANSNLPVNVQLETKYYYIICGLQLNDSSAVPMAISFIDLEHHTPRIEMMGFYLAEYYFRTKLFGDALVYYEKSGIDNLDNAQIAEMKFHKAYSYFALQQFNNARPLFNVIRQIPSDPNYTDANYYFGFISFYDKNYDDALAAFHIAETNAAYQNIVPFYLAEIYYFNGDKDKALEAAENAIKKSGQFYDIQLKQLAGHLLFEKKEYDRARPYLEEYVMKTDKVSRQDLYQLSYCYYVAHDWDKSIAGFKQLGGKEDSLAQNSMYLLADAYLKTGQKANARNAFLFCASNNSNPTQKEISIFSYAKLSYELGFLDIAQKEFQRFISGYPSSVYLQEARELQVSTLANTSNYKDALLLFESLPIQSENVKKVYPRILYGRATELINDQHLDSADELLTRLIKVPYNTLQLQPAYFWKGEIAYRNGAFDDAISYFTEYLKNPKVNGEANLFNARYDLAYSLLKREDYNNALQYFQQIGNPSVIATPTEQDAYLRAADCYFMNRDYKKALEMYETVISQHAKSADYALYQKAVIAGAGNNSAEKIRLLQSLDKLYPGSGLFADASLEIANTYLADEKYTEAIPALNSVLRAKTATALWPQAYLKIGVADFNLDKTDEALSNFKELVTRYPNSPESDEAIEYIRNIFISRQKPGDFIAFMKQNGKPVTYSEEDSLTYRSALLPYEAKDVNNALKGFHDYLAKFPDGQYAVEANYFSAELLSAKKDAAGALPFYMAVAALAPNKYAERSVLQSARTYYFDLKDYANAEKYFIQLKVIATQQDNRLEAMRGLLRCQFKLEQWKEAGANAQELLQEKGAAADDRMMANMVVAKGQQADNQLAQAMDAYRQVIATGKSELAAEAQYHIAEILFRQDNLKESEKAAFEVIRKSGSYELWVTKSYLLLGDIYYKEKDLFNAEATYKSVAENATIAELKSEAQQKLAQVTAEKNKTDKVEQQ